MPTSDATTTEAPGRLTEVNDGPLVCQLTPPGRGAVATVAVCGKRAPEVVGRCFVPQSGRALATLSVGSVAVGVFHSGEDAEEELVVGIPAKDRVEVHCHGGNAAARAVALALVRAGGKEVSQADWLSRHGHDRLRVAAELALPHARTELAAAILREQARGALRGAIEACVRQLRSGDAAGARAGLWELCQRALAGQHLVRPWRIVLVGEPNAGKSSLLNVLLGYERSIVFPDAGTTRDLLSATTVLAGWGVELFDTAGLREGAGGIEAQGMDRTWAQAAEAELVLHVADAAAPWNESLAARIGRLGRWTLIVHSKCDLALPDAARPAGLALSARTGQGVEELGRAMIAALVPASVQPEAAVPFTEVQELALRGALAKLERGDALGAVSRLESLLTTA